MSEFEFQRGRVWYHRSGSGNPMIFLHNGGNDHRIWDFQVEHFQQSHEVIVLDLPGYGRSNCEARDYTLHFYSDMLHVCCEKLELDSVILVGNCVGSATALHFALSMPERVIALVLFNTLTEKTLQKGMFGPLYRFRKAFPRISRFIFDRTEGWTTPAVISTWSMKFQYGNEIERDANFRDHIVSLYSRPHQLAALANLLFHMPGFRELDEQALPVSFPPLLSIWGKENHILSSTAGEDVARRLEADMIEFFDGCGHLVMRERPVEVNALMERFLANHVSGNNEE